MSGSPLTAPPRSPVFAKPHPRHALLTPRRRRPSPTAFRGVASPAMKMRSRSGSARAERAHRPPGDAAEKAPITHVSFAHWVAAVRLTAFLTSAPNRPVSHSSPMPPSPLAGGGKFAAEFAADLDHAQRGAADIGHRRRCGRSWPSRTPFRRARDRADCRQFEGDVIVAAERQLWRWHRAGGAAAPGTNFSLSAISTPVDTVTMTARASTRPSAVYISIGLRPAHSIRVTGFDTWTGSPSPSLAIRAPKPWRQNHRCRAPRSGQNRPRNVGQILGAPNGPSTYSIVCCQSPRSFGSALAQAVSTRPIRPASAMARLARTMVGEEILHLAFTGMAPADPHPLPWRCRIDLEPNFGGERRYRIEVRHMNPMGAAVERHPEGRGIGEAAPADPVRSLDDADLARVPEIGGPPQCRRRRPR